MNLQQQELEQERLENEADEIAMIISSLDTARLHIIVNLASDELVLRYQGKPCERRQLH